MGTKCYTARYIKPSLMLWLPVRLDVVGTYPVPSHVVIHHTLADVCLPTLCIKRSERYLASVLYGAGKSFVSVLRLPVCVIVSNCDLLVQFNKWLGK